MRRKRKRNTDRERHRHREIRRGIEAQTEKIETEARQGKRDRATERKDRTRKGETKEGG